MNIFVFFFILMPILEGKKKKSRSRKWNPCSLRNQALKNAQKKRTRSCAKQTLGKSIPALFRPSAKREKKKDAGRGWVRSATQATGLNSWGGKRD